MSDNSTMPKEELLLKLLNMTTVAEDTVAVIAIRKANELMKATGWTWEKLLAGKIKVVEDPFKNLATPGATRKPDYNTGGIPPRATTPNRPAPPPPPPPPPFRGSPTTPISSTVNRFSGFCWCCGIEAVTNAGFIFKPKPTHTKWEVVCTTCNTSATVYTHAAIPQRAPRKKAVSDLA